MLLLPIGNPVPKNVIGSLVVILLSSTTHVVFLLSPLTQILRLSSVDQSEGNNGYIMITANGGLNQQRVAVQYFYLNEFSYFQTLLSLVSASVLNGSQLLSFTGCRYAML